METLITRRIRLGALAFGISALLLLLFPLVRPFFPLPSGNSPAEFPVIGQTYVMPMWVVSHLMAMAALALLVFGLFTLYTYLAKNGQGRRGFAGMVFSLAGIVLILPTLGVETYALPVIGRAYLDGKADLASILMPLYGGPDTIILLLGLVLLAIGAVFLALSIWTDYTLPKWAGVILAAGLIFWFPLFPQIIRIVDGLLIGGGGLWLAWTIWRKTESMTAKEPGANTSAAYE